MTAIDWRRTQRAIGAGDDGIPGRETFGRLFAFAAMRSPADPVFDRLGQAAAAHFPRYVIVSRERVISTAAETCHETGGFRRFEENLSYSAAGLASTWPSRYAVDPRAKVKVPNAKAQALARRPEAIANDTYALRMGNQSAAADNDSHPDGWQYRGRGMTMLTGKSNYTDVGIALGLPLLTQPELAADPFVSLEIALWFYTKRGVFKAADRSDDRAERTAVNGGLIGFEEVQSIRIRLEGAVAIAA